MKYKGIIFDLDGTLSDSVPCIMKCAELVHRDLGLKWDPEWQMKTIGTPLYQTARLLVSEERVPEYVAANRRYSQKYLAEMIEPFAGIIPLLQDLQEAGIKMCVATSRLKWGADLSCDKIGVTPYLTKIIGVEDTESHKPEAEPALLALEVMGISATEAVFVGDSPVDIGCGQNAGMDSIAVGWGVTPKEKLLEADPTYFCQTVEELRKILLG